MDSIVRINKLTSSVLEDRKNVNKITELMNELALAESEKQSDAFIENLIKCLGKIFNNFIDTREMVLLIESSDKAKKLNSYKTWLVKLYETLLNVLFGMLEDSNNKFSIRIRKVVLVTLIKFIEEEGKFPFRPIQSADENNFPLSLCERIIAALVSDSKSNEELIADYVLFYQYQDVLFFTMRTLYNTLNRLESTTLSEQYLTNMFGFIHTIRLTTPLDLLPESLRTKPKTIKKQQKKKDIRLCELQTQASKFVEDEKKLPTRQFSFDYVRDARFFSKLLVAFLRHQLPPSIYKRSLIFIDKFALQHFAQPLELADFLIGSFEMGGIISLCSLSPLYVLMAKCNLEYRNFYHQLYKLLTPAVTYANHRAQFLFWCDLFLTSSHISAAIVASFVKKLARLAIDSQPDTISIVLPFIGNLLIRHPTIQTMMVRFQQTDPMSDPFEPEETNPEVTKAIDSCLWELSLLQEHFVPSIATIAKQIATDLPKYEWNLSEVFETTLEDVMEKEAKTLAETKFTYDPNCDIFYLL